MNHIKLLHRSGRKLMKTLHSIRRYNKNMYEPDYLESMKSKLALHDVLNIQMRGYDYAILESYQKLVHSTAKNMDINVEECWAVPQVDLNIVTYKPNSELVNSVYKLKVYERTVQVTDVTSLQLPILLRALEASAPAGVTVNVVNHAEYHEETRYVPDKELLTLKQELEDMGHKKK